MKRYGLLIGFLFCTAVVFAQDYTAIHVIGKIYMPEQNAYMKRGDKISESAQLQFQSEDAKAAMLSSSKGRYVIQKNQVASDNDNNLTFALKSLITPAKGQMSTRAAGINNKLNFQKSLGETPVAWLSPEYAVEVSSAAYPMNDDTFFYASYSYKGEPINKLLDFKDNTILFSKETLFSIDDKAIDPAQVSALELYYYDAIKEEADFITNLNFQLVDKAEVAALLEAIPAEIVGDERVQMLYDYLNSLYGKCSMAEVTAAINSLN